ncbi:hypothetical protein FFF34_002820 [Inquilinus sp. KBS0705]|nr:hypothetical protein FFF34_002820 [Inquilinus sp. KBS0705]
MSKVLYTVAVDTNGMLIKANDAEKAIPYFCPVCKSELILRKSGSTLKGAKRPHFAHRTLTPNCTPETALHYCFKMLLADKLQQHIVDQQSLTIAWHCNYCDEPHSGNLLKKITGLKVEHNLVVCQPDIALFDKENKVFAVIEVVVSHKPEQSALDYYKRNNIIMIQINLSSDIDIDNIDSKIANPNRITTCVNPPCTVCGYAKQKTLLGIYSGQCSYCNSPMKVARINRPTHSGISREPGTFTPNELAIAKENGVVINFNTAAYTKTKFLNNQCGACGEFTWGTKMHFDFIALPYDYVEIVTGHHCNHCYEVSNGFNDPNIEKLL